METHCVCSNVEAKDLHGIWTNGTAAIVSTL